MTNIAELANKNKGLTTKETMALSAKDAGLANVKSFFEKNKGAISAVIPKHLSADRMLQIAFGAVRQNPKLQDCTVESLMGVAIRCSQLGLEPNTELGQCYLIPFTNKKKEKQGNKWVDVVKNEVQLIISYKGLIDLARRSGQIISISARTVYENDEFHIFYGTKNEIEHTPALKNRGEIIGFYAFAELKDGGKQFEFMSKEEIDEVRDGSQSAYKDEWVAGTKTGKKIANESSPWFKNYEQMGKKTVLRRLCTYLPQSIEMAKAVAIDTQADLGNQNMEAALVDGEFSVIEPFNDVPDNVDYVTGEILDGEIIQEDKK